jgi:hypothetical protein
MLKSILLSQEQSIYHDNMYIYYFYYTLDVRYIEEEQTTQWPEEKTQKDKQRSTKHTYKMM